MRSIGKRISSATAIAWSKVPTWSWKCASEPIEIDAPASSAAMANLRSPYDEVERELAGSNEWLLSSSATPRSTAVATIVATSTGKSSVLPGCVTMSTSGLLIARTSARVLRARLPSSNPVSGWKPTATTSSRAMTSSGRSSPFSVSATLASHPLRTRTPDSTAGIAFEFQEPGVRAAGHRRPVVGDRDQLEALAGGGVGKLGDGREGVSRGDGVRMQVREQSHGH